MTDLVEQEQHGVLTVITLTAVAEVIPGDLAREPQEPEEQ